MPNKPSARKALRQNKKHAVLNKIRRDAFRDLIKKAAKAAPAEAKKLAAQTQQALDKAAQAGTIKRNTAARKLSRLMKKVNAAVAKK